MKQILGFIFLSLLICDVSYAAKPQTKRVKQFSNHKVDVWRTIIFPHKNQQLKMHRHDQDRVLVALSSGILQVTNNKGESHLLSLQKDHAYYLSKDQKGEFHTDENLTNHPIKVMVINLKS